MRPARLSTWQAADDACQCHPLRAPGGLLLAALDGRKADERAALVHVARRHGVIAPTG
jgi:hypothetical protein